VKVKTDLTDISEIRQGLKQGEGVAPNAFQPSIGICDQKLPVDTNGTLEYKMNQVVGYADDICVRKISKVDK
jgi:hypothetical protein